MAAEDLERRMASLEQLVELLLGGPYPREGVRRLVERRLKEDAANTERLIAAIEQLAESRRSQEAIAQLGYVTQGLSAALERVSAYSASQEYVGDSIVRSLTGLTQSLSNSLERFSAHSERQEQVGESIVMSVTGLASSITAHEREIRRLADEATRQRANAEVETLLLHSYVAALSNDLPVDRLPLQRVIPVRVYLASDSQTSAAKISRAVEQFLDHLGFREASELPAEAGSWFKKWFARSAAVLTKPEVTQRLAKAERALDLALVDTKQAEADRNQAEGAAALIDALKGETHAACQIGSILLVKTTDGLAKSTIVTRTLSQRELAAIEQNPQLMHNPATILACLAESNNSDSADDLPGFTALPSNEQ